MTAAPAVQFLENLAAAATADGTEIMYAEQGGAAKKITVDQIRAGRATLTGAETLTNKTLTAPAINGGTLDGTQTITSQSGFRTALGLGTIATQAASAVAITGGTISGITDLGVADGGTGASNASGARTNLGLAIGSDVQAYNANLAAFAGLSLVADRLPYANGTGTLTLATFTSFGRSLVDDTDAATARSTLGLGTIATQAASSVAITGGAIDGTPIGQTAADLINGTTIKASSSLWVGGTQSVGGRNTGWTPMTGTSNKATVYDTSSVTLPQLAGRVMALQAALATHGLIGP